jgi:predicted RND superfamily exporter protein
VLTLSPFLINAMLGRVVALTIFMALILDFLLLPPLLIALDSRGQTDDLEPKTDGTAAQPAE